MSNVDQLKKAIENISSKQSSLTKEAQVAGKKFDNNSHSFSIQSNKKMQQTLESFNDSVAILVKLFEKSRFDEVMGLMANPIRLVILNFLMSFFKGIGFALGVFTLIYISLAAKIHFFLLNLLK